MNRTPRFEVRAVGAFKQKPGCPELQRQARSPRAPAAPLQGRVLQPVRRAQAHHPHRGRAHPPADYAGRTGAPLIEDPWRTLRVRAERDRLRRAVRGSGLRRLAAARAVYYVRAIEEPSPAVNAGNLRCKYDESGNCIEAHPCYGDYRTPASDDCLDHDRRARLVVADLQASVPAASACGGHRGPPPPFSEYTAHWVYLFHGPLNAYSACSVGM